MNEAVCRRLSEKNVKQWGLPQLFLIDGGKGQVGAAYAAMSSFGYSIPMIGLAKRYEEIILPVADQADSSKITDFNVIVLSHSDDALKLLMRIRDESHRFAVSYHSVLKRNRQKVNLLEEIPGIGPQSRKLLQRHFGSTKAVFEAAEKDIVAIVGSAKAKIILDNRPNSG